MRMLVVMLDDRKILIYKINGMWKIFLFCFVRKVSVLKKFSNFDN